MRAQEKVKRELAEIKDAKTQLERELERKNRQLLSAESEPAAAPAPAAEAPKPAAAPVVAPADGMLSTNEANNILANYKASKAK